jgi:hypothetical protein
VAGATDEIGLGNLVEKPSNETSETHNLAPSALDPGPSDPSGGHSKVG